MPDHRHVHGRMHVYKSGDYTCTNYCAATGSHQYQSAGSVDSQITPAAEVSSSAQDLGLVSDEAEDAVNQAEAFNTTQATNASPDSQDFGDIMP